MFIVLLPIQIIDQPEYLITQPGEITVVTVKGTNF